MVSTTFLDGKFQNFRAQHAKPKVRQYWAVNRHTHHLPNRTSLFTVTYLFQMTRPVNVLQTRDSDSPPAT